MLGILSKKASTVRFCTISFRYFRGFYTPFSKSIFGLPARQSRSQRGFCLFQSTTFSLITSAISLPLGFLPKNIAKSPSDFLLELRARIGRAARGVSIFWEVLAVGAVEDLAPRSWRSASRDPVGLEEGLVEGALGSRRGLSPGRGRRG